MCSGVNCKVGSRTIHRADNSPCRIFAVRTFRRTDISPWDFSPEGLFAVNKKIYILIYYLFFYYFFYVSVRDRVVPNTNRS